MKRLGLMPTHWRLCPEKGDVGKKYLQRKLSQLSLDDSLVILSILSRHNFKYVQYDHGNEDPGAIYRQRCLELLSEDFQRRLRESEKKIDVGKDSPRSYDIIFPDMSIVYLIRMCLIHCRKDIRTEGEEFDRAILECIGECLLVANGVFEKEQQCAIPANGGSTGQLNVDLTRQLIINRNVAPIQKFSRAFFLYCEHYNARANELDVNAWMLEHKGVSTEQYFALLWLMFNHFRVDPSPDSDYEGLPHINRSTAFINLKDTFDVSLIDELTINSVHKCDIGDNFWDVHILQKKPLYKRGNGNIIILNIRSLILGLTESVYFEILDSLVAESEKETKSLRSSFSGPFGRAVEGYTFDIFKKINKSAQAEFQYKAGKNLKHTPDVLVPCGNTILFVECKRRQFHDNTLLLEGNVDWYTKRLEEFCKKPLVQLRKRILDYRKGLFSISGFAADSPIFPVVVSPVGVPIFEGAWDLLELEQYVYPDGFRGLENVARPEFIDLDELESIEEYLRLNPSMDFTALLFEKQADVNYRNGNWLPYLHSKNIAYRNSRLERNYLDAQGQFKDLLFDSKL